jgi:hypothetical protein
MSFHKYMNRIKNRKSDSETICGIGSLQDEKKVNGDLRFISNRQEVLGRTNSPTFATYVIYLKYLNLI